MAKKKTSKKQVAKKTERANNETIDPILNSRLKRWITAILMVVLGSVVALSFFDKAGTSGETIFNSFSDAIGKTVYFTPFLLFLAAFLIIKPQGKRVFLSTFLGLFIIIIGIAGLLTAYKPELENGGFIGSLVAWPILKYFGETVVWVVFPALILIGGLILWEFLPKKIKERKEQKEEKAKEVPVKVITETPVEQLMVEKKEKPKFQIKSIELEQKKEKTDKKGKREIILPPPPKLPKDLGGDYKRPPISLFDTNEEQAQGGDTEQNALIIKKTFQNFGIEVEMHEANVGPTVTQYSFKPAEGVKLSKITTLNNDLALALAAHPIRIEAPIPGKALVGIEVPNKSRAVVKVGNLIASNEFQTSSASLLLSLGRDVMGKDTFSNLGGMPHLLVAGATGSGKTICLNALIVSLICRNSPKIMRLILIDPKRVEFPVYANLPHLLTPVIFNSQKAVNALNWLVGEMERRFDVLKDFGARDISSYNQTLQAKPKKKDEGFEVMPYIVLIIDELADLMMAKGKEVEAAVVRISQLARAVGIHLILATQRPSVEVITGLIKANITSRIAFQVASQIDSRTILDTSGAEKLLGKGDMLFLSSEFSKPRRIQGNFITTPEIKKVVRFIEKENTPEENGVSQEQTELSAPSTESEEIIRKANPTPHSNNSSLNATNATTNNNNQHIDLEDVSLEEPLYNEAKEVVIEYGKASASLLQRRLKIGYARAARILDLLEQNEVVGPQEGSRPREVYETPDHSRYELEDKNNDGFIDAGEIEIEPK